MSDPTLISVGMPVLQALAPQVLAQMGKALKLGVTKIRARLASTFERHMEITYARCSKVKTLFSEDRPIPLSSIYVNLYLKSDNRIIRDEDLLSADAGASRAVITGTGGAGKTMIMRHLAITHYENPNGYIPIFVELRSLSHAASEDFIRTVFQAVTPAEMHSSYDLFVEGLRAGAFTLFLDGLDEVPPDSREEIFKAIQRIPLDFPKTRIIASARPEIDVTQWEQFTNFHVQGLNISQINVLIKKIPYDSEIKEAFLEKINEGMFKEHNTFLSIPLLCSLMLLTFHEFSDIPSRVTVFYEQAFDTLYRKHDSSKGLFKRKHESQLSIDRFRHLFSAFCYRTLALHKVSFSDDELRQHLNRAIEASEIDVDVEKYASDLVSAVCLIMRDGLSLHFIHRSFQDYFAALYMLRYRGADAFSVFDRVFSDSFVSNVIDMTVDIDSPTVERVWALPTIRKLDKMIKSWPKAERWHRLLSKTYFELRVDASDGRQIFGWSWLAGDSFHGMMEALSRMYKDNGIGMRFFNGVLNDSFEHVCELRESGITLPTPLDIACDNWNAVDYVDEGIEVLTEDADRDWLLSTTLPQTIDELCDNISSLRSVLEARADKRRRLNLLS